MRRGIFHTPVMHFEDINGRPLVGGRLYSFFAGTFTPVNLYRNDSGDEIHTNPIILNQRGECSAYGMDGVMYKFVLKNALGVTIWEKDNVHIDGCGFTEEANISFKAVYGVTPYSEVKEACDNGMRVVVSVEFCGSVMEMPASYQSYADHVSFDLHNPNANISHLVSVSAAGWATEPGYVQHGYSEVQANVPIVDVRMKNGTITKVDIASSGTYTLNFVVERPIQGYGAFAHAFFNVQEDSELTYIHAYVVTDDGWKELPILGYNPPFERGKTYLVEIVGEVARITFMDYTPQPEPTIEVEAWMLPDEETAWMWPDGSVIALPDGETFNLLAPNGDVVLAPNGDNVIVDFGG